jgi:pyroglutamyl-peptidase
MLALLFGFGPFSKYSENPSQIILERLNGKKINGIEIRSIILPVTYSRVKRIIKEEITRYKPDLVLGIGLAAGRNKITLEKIAINYEFSKIPDNLGKKGKGKKIDPKGPDGIFTNIDIENLVKILNSNNIPADISLSAGSYICNLAMYFILQNTLKSGIKGGFVHIPCHRELVAKVQDINCPFMELDSMQKAIEIIISYS